MSNGVVVFWRMRRNSVAVHAAIVFAVLCALLSVPGSAHAQLLCRPDLLAAGAAGHCCEAGEIWDVGSRRCAVAPRDPYRADQLTTLVPGGVLLLAVGIAGSVLGIYALSVSGSSCQFPPAMTATERSDLSSCQSGQGNDVVLGVAGLGLGLAAAITGVIELTMAVRFVRRPTAVNSERALAATLHRVAPWRFTGLEPTVVPGGGVVRAGIAF